MGNVQSSAPLSQQEAQYVPPKVWAEITSEEKIERMREIIKELRTQVGRAQTDIHWLRQNFGKHQHTEKGIVLPFNEYGNQGSGLVGTAVGNLNNDYF